MGFFGKLFGKASAKEAEWKDFSAETLISELGLEFGDERQKVAAEINSMYFKKLMLRAKEELGSQDKAKFLSALKEGDSGEIIVTIASLPNYRQIVAEVSAAIKIDVTKLAQKIQN